MPYAMTPDKVRLYYEEVGQGMAILFVHEFAGDHRTWEPQLRTALRLSLEPAPADPPMLRQGRAIGWIEDALTPKAWVRAGVHWNTARLRGSASAEQAPGTSAAGPCGRRAWWIKTGQP